MRYRFISDLVAQIAQDLQKLPKNKRYESKAEAVLRMNLESNLSDAMRNLSELVGGNDEHETD